MEFRMQEGKVKKRYYHDYSLLLTVIILVVFGLIMIYSASSFSAQLEFKDSAYYIKRQAFFAVLGFVAMFFVSRFDYHFVLKLSNYIYAASVIMLILVYIIGSERNGKKRWLKFGPINIQPAEIAKLALILCMSIIIYKFYKHIDSKRAILRMTYYVFPLVALIAPNNMSSAIIVALIPVFMHFSVSRNIGIHILLAILGVIVVSQALPIATFLNKLHIVQNYQLQRIIVWKNPEADPAVHGFQVLQGLYAIGAGGLFGRGMGAGMQKFLLPESQNDMIFSIYASGFAPANTKLTSLIRPCIRFGPFCFSLLAYILNDEISPCSTKDFTSFAASVLLKVQYAYTPSSLFSNTA